MKVEPALVTEQPLSGETHQDGKTVGSLVDKSAVPPKRIILFIGDGMGVGAVTAATYAKGKPLHMLGMPHFSWMSTHEYEFLTTDSAASATAMASGVKTIFEAVGLSPGATSEDRSQRLRTVLAAAQEAGMKTGLVATSRINHATPAAFAANRLNRRSYDEIASDLAGSSIDLLLGAGSDFFDKRKDGQNLFNKLKEEGYTIAKTPDEVRKAASASAKLVGLMEPKDFPPVRTGKRPMTLKEMTEIAIRVLDSKNDKGWFLMVEGSQIDWCEHDLDGLCTISETLEFDDAVGVGRDYAKSHSDALVIVTADHETAGASVLDPPVYSWLTSKIGDAKTPPSPFPATVEIGDSSVQYAANPGPKPTAFGFTDLADDRFTLSFGYLSTASRASLGPKELPSFSGAHTTTFVPLFSEGASASTIATVTDNAELGRTLIRLVDAPSATLPPVQESPPKNVILLIGDGMGINSVTAAYYGQGNPTLIDAPIKGLISTHATNAVVNDSAATATAIASGYRTRKGALGLTFKPGEPTQVPVESILERAEAAGHRTGLVTTVPLTHATPAAFYAHVKSRSENATIADHFISLSERIPGSDGIDVAIAGGLSDFPKAKQDLLSKLGYTIYTDWNGEPLKDKAVVLRANKGMAIATKRKAAGGPSLATMTSAAIAALTKPTPNANTQNDKPQKEKGFFLMVEGGQIDWLLHGMVQTSELIDEIADFNDAVQAAVDYAKKSGDTLVLVTADHDHTMSVLDNHYAYQKPHNCRADVLCGGKTTMPQLPVVTQGIKDVAGFTKTPLQGKAGNPKMILQYDWVVSEAERHQGGISGPHSANFVPLFAWGPRAHKFEGYLDQPDFGKRIFQVTGW